MVSVDRRFISAWVAYGMAGSGYLLMIPTIAYAAYYRTHVAGGRPDADAIWGLVVASALVIAGTIGPFLGAYADRSATKRGIVGGLTVLTVALTALLVVVAQGDIVLGAVLFVGAHSSFLLAKALYDSYLPELGDPASLPFISGFGWGLGYVGSIACFLICLPLIRGGAEQSDPGLFRMSFVVTACFFALIALPALLWFPSGRAERQFSTLPAGSATAQVFRTIRRWRDHRETFKFLLAFYLINDAVVTVILFIGIYLKVTFGLSVEEILKLTLLFYAIGIPATAAFGWLGRRWSERGALYVSLAIWLVLLWLLAIGTHSGVPIAAACLAGLVIGSTQALCRSMYARIIPPGRASEFFGFNAFVGRASAALGPLAFGLVSSVTGSQRIAMASLTLFLVSGGVVLFFVRTEAMVKSEAKPDL